MLRINKYVEVIDSAKIISIGKYRIGTEIPCGEYYLWGQDIWYSYKRKKEKEYHEYTSVSLQVTKVSGAESL